MDVIFRLRVLIWVVVLCLWGIMVYQFLGEEEAEQKAQQMAFVANPYKGMPLPPPGPAELPPAPQTPEAATQAATRAAADSAALVHPPEPGPPPSEVSSAGPAAAAQAARSSLDLIKPAPPQTPPPSVARTQAPMRREGRIRRKDLPPPPGFVKTVSRHFIIYAEGAAASEEFVGLIENLHGNLMLDLASFSPWVGDHKVMVYLFKNQNTYQRVTGRPAWSGGSSSVENRKVYIYESEDLPGILAHEMCHIYYDGFYIGGKPDPLWLSEGMATLIQVERGLAAPNWLRENMEILERGGGFSLQELMSVTSTAGADDDRVRLWYTQSYSIVRFLIRAQYKSSFFRFSTYLREGKDVTQSLYRGYGMPYNRIKALEYAWRYQLTTKAMGQVGAAER